MKDGIICKFSLACDQEWDNLEEIEGSENTRFCIACETPVYLSRTYEELATNVAARRCVAIRVESTSANSPVYVGLMEPLEGSRSFDPILFIAVGDLGLTPQVSSDLHRCGVRMIGDLIQLSREELLAKFALTEADLDRVEEALTSRGLTLGMKIENWNDEYFRFQAQDDMQG